MLVRSARDAKLIQVEGANGMTGGLAEYLGSARVSGAGPQAYLVMMAPRTTNVAHFHDVDQFLVFFGRGGATFRRRKIPAVMVHYSDANTPYGPYRSRDESLEFLALRADSTKGAYFMGRKKDRALARGGRAIEMYLGGNLIPDPLPKREGEKRGDLTPSPSPEREGGKNVKTLIEAQPDGLAAFLLVNGPGERVAGPDLPQGEGEYFVVIGGSVRYGEEELPERSLFFCESSKAAPRMTAGPGGSRVLALQLPRKRGAQA